MKKHELKRFDSKIEALSNQPNSTIETQKAEKTKLENQRQKVKEYLEKLEKDFFIGIKYFDNHPYSQDKRLKNKFISEEIVNSLNSDKRKWFITTIILGEEEECLQETQINIITQYYLNKISNDKNIPQEQKNEAFKKEPAIVNIQKALDELSISQFEKIIEIVNGEFEKLPKEKQGKYKPYKPNAMVEVFLKILKFSEISEKEYSPLYNQIKNKEQISNNDEQILKNKISELKQLNETIKTLKTEQEINYHSTLGKWFDKVISKIEKNIENIDMIFEQYKENRVNDTDDTEKPAYKTIEPNISPLNEVFTTILGIKISK